MPHHRLAASLTDRIAAHPHREIGLRHLDLKHQAILRPAAMLPPGEEVPRHCLSGSRPDFRRALGGSEEQRTGGGVAARRG
uniref:Uncharacterized protein n=1 Tax=Arundo donax TaxID=35708 RepID=A0A0A8ZE89_ARUDO